MIQKHLLKSAAVAGAIAALSPAAQAQTGIYAGAGVGMTVLSGKSNLSVSRTFPPPLLNGLIPQSFNTNMSDKNIAGDLFIGYGKRFNCFWGSIEALASFSSLRSKQFLDISQGAVTGNGQFLANRTTHAFGGSVNLGHHLNDTTRLYIKLGFEARRFQATFISDFPFADDPLVGVNKRYWSTGFVPGIGLETELSPRFAVRTEYRCAFHKGKTVQVANSATEFSTITTKPTLHTFNVGLIVKI